MVFFGSYTPHFSASFQYGNSTGVSTSGSRLTSGITARKSNDFGVAKATVKTPQHPLYAASF